MTQKKILFALLFSCFFTANAQQFEYAWSHAADTSEADYVYPIGTEISGDTLYAMFEFTADSVDACPGINEDWLYDTDLTSPSRIYYVSRFLTDGTYINSVALILAPGQNITVYDFEVASTGIMVLTGSIYYSGSAADFDPSAASAAVQQITNPGESGQYLAFYNLANIYLGHVEYKTMGSWPSYTSGVNINSIDCDENSQLYVAGNIHGTTDMDFTAGIDNITAAGGGDCFIMKVDLITQTYVWTKHFGSSTSSAESLDDIVVANGKIAVSGRFNDEIFDADPGPGVYNLTKTGTLSDWLILGSFDTDGNLLEAIHFGQVNGNLYAHALEHTEQGQIILTTMINESETVDIDPIGGGQIAYSADSYNLLVASYNSDLTLNWFHVMSSDGYMSSSYTEGVTSGSSFVAYSFTTDPDPITFVTATDTTVWPGFGTYATGVMVVNQSNGSLLDSIVWTTYSLDEWGEIFGLQLDQNNNVYVYGIFYKEFDFNFSDLTYTPDYSEEYNPGSYYDNAFLCKVNFNGFASEEWVNNAGIISIYPNPAADFITISTFQNTRYVKIISITGQVCYEAATFQSGKFNVDVSTLSPGIYQIVLVDTNGQQVTSKFIKY